MIGEPAPQLARIGRPAPKCAVERVAHDFDQVRRLFGVHGAKTDPLQKKFRPAVLGKRDPVSVDLLKEGPCGIGAIARVHKQIQPTGEIGILHGDARDCTVVQILDAVDRRGVNPARARRRHHGQHGSLEPSDAL
jgi:hypothetical protein